MVKESKKEEITVTPINKDVENVQIVKVGNAHYLNLPAAVMSRNGLREGQRVDYTLKNVVIGMFPHNLVNSIAFA